MKTWSKSDPVSNWEKEKNERVENFKVIEISLFNKLKA